MTAAALLLSSLCLAASDAGTAADAGPTATASSALAGDAGYDPKKPATWRTSVKLGPGSKDREALIKEWTAPSKDVHEAALTQAQAEALLDDPRAEQIYWEKTISIVAPSMIVRQRQAHVDLLKLFLVPERLEAGEKFFDTHRALLEKEGGKNRVDPAVIVGILMFETRLGTITGDFSAFNSFISQAFFIDEASAAALTDKAELKLHNAERQAQRVETIRTRARKNLAVLVRQCAAKQIDALSVKGSWAGALGYPQFMPASLRWARDGNGDGKIDLYTFEDSIASVANYLGEFGFAKDRQKAVWGYNHEAAYVSGVLGYADALSARMKKDAGTPRE